MKESAKDIPSIPCEQNDDLRSKIKAYADVLKTEAHTIGDHGLSEQEFYNSGLFRGAIERIRGQFSATMKPKRAFVKQILDYMRAQGFIEQWQSAGESNRHDYVVQIPSGRTCVIELKGCLDGNNTNIFERPPNADEFVIWSVCSNPGADPRHNVWSGIHTRLSAEIISREQRIDGVIVWDMVCATVGRPCPKTNNAKQRLTKVGTFNLPPACIYLFPSTIPSPRNNAHPKGQALDQTHFLKALHQCFNGSDKELHFVDFSVGYHDNEIVRSTTIRQPEGAKESKPTPIRRK